MQSVRKMRPDAGCAEDTISGGKCPPCPAKGSTLCGETIRRLQQESHQPSSPAPNQSRTIRTIGRGAPLQNPFCTTPAPPGTSIPTGDILPKTACLCPGCEPSHPDAACAVRMESTRAWQGGHLIPGRTIQNQETHRGERHGQGMGEPKKPDDKKGVAESPQPLDFSWWAMKDLNLQPTD